VTGQKCDKLFATNEMTEATMLLILFIACCSFFQYTLSTNQ